MAFVNPARNYILNEVGDNHITSLALYTTAPDEDGVGGVEVGAGLGYARQVVSGLFTLPPVGGVMANTTLITFGPATGDWGTIEGIALINDAGSFVPAGDVIIRWLPASRTVTEGGTYQIAIGDLIIAMEDA